MESFMKKVLPINEKPSVITCIHHAYPCAIIESRELAIISVRNLSLALWEKITNETSVHIEDDTIKILEEGKGENTNTVLWRKCKKQDEIILKVDYIKSSNFTRYIDVFLFYDNLESEIEKVDKSCGIRWNPYGYFIEKNMYCFDTKIYIYIKFCIETNFIKCYASKDGANWEYIDQIGFPVIHNEKEVNVGIHVYCGKNKYIDWKNMNFIQLIYNESNPNKGINLDYYFFPKKNNDNSYSYFINFIDTHYDSLYDALECFPSIHEYLHWNIRHSYYVNVFLDEYYVADRYHYKKSHYDHYNLFYGFDDYKRVYFIMGYGKNSTPVISEISYDVIDQNIISSQDTVRYKYCTNGAMELQFNVKPLIVSLYEYLYNINSSEKVSNLIAGENVSYGISILKKLANTATGKCYVRGDKRIAFLLVERSKIMGERINYLYANKYLKNDAYVQLLKQNEEISNISSIILSLILKNKIKPIDDVKIDQYLLKLYETEKSFCENLLNCLTKDNKSSDKLMGH